MAENERTNPDTPVAIIRVTENILQIATNQVALLAQVVDPTPKEAAKKALWESILSKKGRKLSKEEVEALLRIAR